MTENLLQKLEEKVMTLISELETLRTELKQARSENIALRNEKATSTSKLQELVSLLDTMDMPSQTFTHDVHLSQGRVDFVDAMA